MVATSAPHHSSYEGPYHHNQLQNAALFHKQDYEGHAEQPSHHLGYQEHHQKVAQADAHHEGLAQSYANSRLISGPHQKVYIKAHQVLEHHQAPEHQVSIHSHYVPSHQTLSLSHMKAPIQYYEAPKLEVSTEGMTKSHSEEPNREIYHVLEQAAVEENQDAHKGWEEYIKSQKAHQTQQHQYEHNVKTQASTTGHGKQEIYNGWEEYFKNREAQVPATGHQAHGSIVVHEALNNAQKSAQETQKVQYAQGYVSVDAHHGHHDQVPFMAHQQQSQVHVPVVAHQAHVPAVIHEAHVPVVAHKVHVPVVTHESHVPAVTHEVYVPAITHESHVPAAAHQAHVPIFTHEAHVPAVTHEAHVPAVTHESHVPVVPHHAHKEAHVVDYYAHPEYKFEYGVNDPHTKDHKSHWEQRDGHVVKGAYTLDEADGTKRVVEYTADKKSGFNAVVKRTGHAFHPQIYGKPEPKTFHQIHNHQEEEQEKHGH